MALEKNVQGGLIMHRIFWLSISGKRMHLLKLAGAFFVLFSVLMVANAAYSVFVPADKINAATTNPKLSEQLFGWALSAGRSEFSSEVWLGTAVLSLIVYQSGKVIVPIEEYEQTLGERHRRAFHNMVRRAKR